jgi:hypothetical protein
LQFPNSTVTRAWGIDGNNIVGEYDDATGSHGFQYDAFTQSWTTINSPFTLAMPRDISGVRIVGSYHGANNSSHGFLFDGASWMTFDDPLQAVDGEALGISGSNVVGWYDNPHGLDHGYFYDGTTFTTLDYPSATGNTIAFGVSGNRVVGVYSNAQGGGHGFLAIVPEPSTLLLLTLGGFALTAHAALRLRRRR